MAKKKFKKASKTSSLKDFSKYAPYLERINDLEKVYETLSDEELSSKTTYFKQHIKEGNDILDILPDAFAAVREASKRTIGLRHYDVQMIGGIVMHEGKIAEMRTGEGKTLAATLSLYLNALYEKGVHLVTVNDYLARRDARWMAPIYNALGLSVGVLQMASRTENGRMAFLVAPDKRSPKEEDDQLVMVPRREAYLADITYGTNNEFGFDYLRDNLVNRLEDRVQRGHFYAIVDEIDNILIDEARTPLIISGKASEDIAWYEQMAKVVTQLNEDDYDFSEKDHSVALTEIGEVHVEELLNTTLRDPDRPEDITPEQARLLGYLEQALKAKLLFHRNKDYIIQNNEIIIVDEFTGRLMPGRRWSEGLHQAVEAKEGVRVNAENITQATITLQNYFRMYEKLAGMTGTALTEAEEFYTIYELEVNPIPTNLDYAASLSNSDLDVFEKKDSEGYTYTTYVNKDDPDQKEAFWKRKDYPDIVYQTRESKLRAISLEIVRYNAIGRPQLVGTTSIVHSEELSSRLKRDSLRLLLQIIILKARWREKFGITDEERAIPELEGLNDPLESLSPAILRDLAQKNDLGSLSLENPENLDSMVRFLQLSDGYKPRLQQILNAGIVHKVLNALKHDEESQIIAGAGAYGAVTIATNMAGRGVDIKLGGELEEHILSDVVQALNANQIDPYDMSYTEMEAALQQLSPEQYQDQEQSVQTFLDYLVNLRTVREIGGLHVIGSERHEARRIDNQLRGRAARQGDPGSSRFFLSLEDDLMRLFGGERVENLMNFFKLDKSLPIENRMIGRLVEQSQERVEGYNFDIRKHLLEYDDVLNDQRTRIYDEREKAISKEDLSDDIWGMVESELQRRVPASLEENTSPWKLCAFLDEIQPTMINAERDIFIPSFTYHLLSKSILNGMLESREKDRIAYLTQFVTNVITAEKKYALENISLFIDNSADAYENQYRERMDDLEAFLDGVQAGDAGSMEIKEFKQQLQSFTHFRLQIDQNTAQALINGERDAVQSLKEQFTAALFTLYLNRVSITIQKRIGEQTNLAPVQVVPGDWKTVKEHYLYELGKLFDRKIESVHTGQSEIAKNIGKSVQELDGKQPSERWIISTLFNISNGKRVAINPQNHQRVLKPVLLLNYVFYAAEQISGMKSETLITDIMDHLQKISALQQNNYGLFELARLSQTEITLRQLNPSLSAKMQQLLPPHAFEQKADTPVRDLDEETRSVLQDVLGQNIQTMLHRHVLLNNITSIWVEHLTQMEALRVSIGLEAYAQRDPLVQYKNQSSDMFRDLLANIRLGVMSQIFRLQPVQRKPEAPSAAQPAPKSEQTTSTNKKRRRRR